MQELKRCVPSTYCTDHSTSLVSSSLESNVFEFLRVESLTLFQKEMS